MMRRAPWPGGGVARRMDLRQLAGGPPAMPQLPASCAIF